VFSSLYYTLIYTVYNSITAARITAGPRLIAAFF